MRTQSILQKYNESRYVQTSCILIKCGRFLFFVVFSTMSRYLWSGLEKPVQLYIKYNPAHSGVPPSLLGISDGRYHNFDFDTIPITFLPSIDGIEYDTEL